MKKENVFFIMFLTVIWTAFFASVITWGIMVTQKPNKYPEFTGGSSNIETAKIWDNPSYVKEIDNLEIKLKIAIFENGYKTGALHVLRDGWSETQWKKDSIIFCNEYINNEK